MYDFEDSDDTDFEDGISDDYEDDADCYTHTMTLEGQCWVICDKTLL